MQLESHVCLLGKFLFFQFGSLCHLVCILDTHHTFALLIDHLLVFVVVSQEVFSQLLQVLVVFFFDFGQSEARRRLLVHELSESSFSLEEAERYALLPAECGEEDHHFDWVDVVSNDDELGSIVFNEFRDVVDSELDIDWLGALLLVLCVNFVFGIFLEAGFLFFMGLWCILAQQFN